MVTIFHEMGRSSWRNGVGGPGPYNIGELKYGPIHISQNGTISVAERGRGTRPLQYWGIDIWPNQIWRNGTIVPVHTISANWHMARSIFHEMGRSSWRNGVGGPGPYNMGELIYGPIKFGEMGRSSRSIPYPRIGIWSHPFFMKWDDRRGGTGSGDPAPTIWGN
jgi:hypothetical protein